MTKLTFTDPHITEDSLEELELVFKEIFQQKADVLIMVGDYYDKNKPTAKEVIFGTKWAYFFKKKFKKVIFVRGNHTRTEGVNWIDYLQYIGIECVNDYKDDDGTYYGHFMVNESKLEYGTGKCGIKDLAKHNFVVLGHQHSFQKLADNAIHLGSVRYVNFNESKDKEKYILFAEGRLSMRRIKLKSPTPMIDVTSIKELGNIKSQNTKVRLVISSYKQFKQEVNEIAKWKNKFFEFKVKLDFTKEVIKKEDKLEVAKKKKLEDVLREGIKKIEDKEVRKLLEDIIK